MKAALGTDNYTGINFSYLRSFAYTGCEHIPDTLGIEYLRGDHEHALQEIVARIQREVRLRHAVPLPCKLTSHNKMATWDQEARWRIDMWRRPPSSVASRTTGSIHHINYIEHQVQAMNDEQVRRAVSG